MSTYQPSSSSSTTSARAPATDDLASWVQHVRQRNSSSSPASSPVTASNLLPTSSEELDLQRQKQERQERRNRLSVSGIRGLSYRSTSPLTSPSAYQGSDYMLPSSESAKVLGSSPTKPAAMTGMRRADSFLAKYGGQAGPTGVAAGPQAASDSPVSLASFMGGKAAGPRLGKLVGDGKSAPPEAELIHQSRGMALPGLANPTAQYGGRSLASFLGDRSDALGNGLQRSSTATSASPDKSSTGYAAPARAATADNEAVRSASPAKYNFSQKDLGRPTKTASDVQAPLTTAPGSPKKAYLDLMEKQQASAPVSPIIQRASSPSKFPRFGGDSIPASPKLERPSSPTKKHSFTESRPLPVPSSHSNLQSAYDATRKDMATSPIKAGDLAAPLTNSEAALPSADSRPRLTSRSSELSESDRLPTPTLTRLHAQRMVGQRIKEAQSRDAAAQKELETQQVGSGRSMPSSPAVRERWPPSSVSSQNLASPSKPSLEDTRSTGWSPTKYGNALPGLASRSPTKESVAGPWTSSPSPQPVDEPRAEPIRLPGMGAGVSPFKRAEAVFTQADDSVLTSLTKSRAKGPTRRSGPAKTSEPARAAESALPAQHPEPAVAAAPAADKPAEVEGKPATVESKPLRRTTGPRIHVLVSGSGSNLQSLIDATLKSPLPGLPTISEGQISFVLSNRKAAYGLTRAAESNPPIPTRVLSLKTWQSRNPGGTREDYDQVLARAVLDGADETGRSAPPDLIVLAGFMHIVSEPFLHALGHSTSLPESTHTIGQRPRKPVPIINLHPALPHAFDGANAIPRAFDAYQQGLTDKTGCMVHEVVADVDRGRPIIVREVPILPSYTLDLLEEAIHKIEHVIIVQAADLVLKGYLEQLDKTASAENRSTQAEAASTETQIKSKSRNSEESVQVRNLHGKDVVSSAASLLASDKGAWRRFALSSSSLPQQATSANTSIVEVISIGPDGATNALKIAGARSSETGEDFQEEHVVYDVETLVVVARDTRGTQIWVRTGMTSALHPFELGPMSTSCPEGRKVAEVSRRYSVQPRFIPAGCEDHEIVSMMGAPWLVNRLGSREAFDASAPSLYRVRRAIASDDHFSVSQTSLTPSSISSGDSCVLSRKSVYLVWHGQGSCAATRRAAVRFANALARSDSTSGQSDITELVEGSGDGQFWRELRNGESKVSAWYHTAQAHVPRSSVSSLLDIDVRHDQLSVSAHSNKGYFGTDDLLLPTRNDKVSILNLEDRELFVVVSQDARGDRLRIAAAIQIAQQFAILIQDRLRSLLSSDEAIVSRPAVHVLILPSKLPQSIRAAARIWSEEIVDYLQGPSTVQMNVHSDVQALSQLQLDSWPIWQLQDLDCLPVGVTPADVPL